jgi:glutamine cyclotransferase
MADKKHGDFAFEQPGGGLAMVKRFWWVALPVVGLAILAIVSSNAATEVDVVPTYSIRVLAEFPHDATSFSQGLAVEGETLFEGTGKYGASVLRKIELQTGKVQNQVALDRAYFGEGITVLGDRIYQLTWKERVCAVYDKATLRPIGSLRYAGEGWGLADDEKQIYMSDGSSTIRVLDPQTFKVIREIAVRNGRRRLQDLNELEFINGEIYANVWYKDVIARIDPETGNVKGWIDCAKVFPAATRPSREHVLNGIAYDADSGRLFITGKHWPKLYEIEVLDSTR